MAEQNHSQISSVSKRSNQKPFPMKIFASWEIDNSSPHCVPRLCMLTATSLQILDISEIDDCKDVVLSVQMQRGRNRRVLRSGSIELNTQCTETELEITFSLQYPHFLKRDDNCLRISLQRRNRSNYKKFLGFKTIAMGMIDLSQVLQKPLDLRLDMFSTDSKHRNKVIATVTLQHITSKPLSNISNSKHNSTSGSGVDRSENSDSADDDDYENSYSEDDNQHGFRSDNQVNEQRNIKQRFAKLLRRFKSSDDAEKQILNALERKSSRMRRSGEREIRDEEVSVGSEVNLDELFDELENLSDSDNNEQDNISIKSTPKPSLPIYFTECGSSETLVRNSLERDGSLPHDTRTADNQHQTPDLTPSLDSPTEQLSLFPNKFDILLYERIFTDSDSYLPEYVYLVDERPTHNLPALAHSLYQSISKLYPCHSVKITNKDETTQLMLRLSKAIEKFCNNNSLSPIAVKLILVGADGFFSMVLDAYVKVFSQKPPDWSNYVRTVIVPLGRSSLYSRLCQSHPTLNNVFGNDSNWNTLVDKASSPTLAGDCTLMVDTLRQTVNKCFGLIQTPICEAMITYKPIQTDQSQVQQFIPFITDVLIGNMTVNSESNTEELNTDKKLMMSTSPPSFYHTSSQSGVSPLTTSPSGLTSSAPEIVLDFWSTKEKTSKTLHKETLKGCFKYILVYRERNYFTLECQLKDKKPKNPVMRIGKRPKDKTKDSDKKSVDHKSGKIVKEHITRIVCSTKDDNNRLSVLVDQVEYTGIHFFQLSTQWQSHVKHLPIAVKQAMGE